MDFSELSSKVENFHTLLPAHPLACFASARVGSLASGHFKAQYASKLLSFKWPLSQEASKPLQAQKPLSQEASSFSSPRHPYR